MATILPALIYFINKIRNKLPIHLKMDSIIVYLICNQKYITDEFA